MNILWFCNADLTTPNGANIRYENFVRRLAATGHRFHFVIPDWAYNDETDFRIRTELGSTCERFNAYRATGERNAISRLLLAPRLRHRFLRDLRLPYTEALRKTIRERRIDVLVVSERMHLFMFNEGIQEEAAVVADLVDFLPLQHFRSLRQAALAGDFRALLAGLSKTYQHLRQDVFASKHADATVFVAPADAEAARRLGAERVELLFNGVDVCRSHAQPKLPGRIVFPGVMSFEPNYQGAIWFIDKVLPAVRARRPDALFVAAGADPIPALLARAGESVIVTGRVPDLSREIARASVCAVPLISGSGFKNKVVEGMAAGTYVVGTRYASEFLPSDLKACMTTCSSAEELARQIVAVLDSPESYRPVVEKAQQILVERFSWDRQAREFERILVLAHARFLARRKNAPRSAGVN